jgi:GNAT superfamily N-acetyltransferase
MTPKLGAPEPLGQHHRLAGFVCGEPSLDDWLLKRAAPNQMLGARRTFVVADASGQVLGYYALAAGAVAHEQATGAIRRNMPDPVPVMVLARLAVDRQAQGLQLGGALLRDAVLRCTRVAQDAGVRALLVHALHDRAAQFYRHYGFQPSPTHAMTLMLRLPTG